jgi:hypothetical protein
VHSGCTGLLLGAFGLFGQLARAITARPVVTRRGGSGSGHGRGGVEQTRVEGRLEPPPPGRFAGSQAATAYNAWQWQGGGKQGGAWAGRRECTAPAGLYKHTSRPGDRELRRSPGWSTVLGPRITSKSTSIADDLLTSRSVLWFEPRTCNRNNMTQAALTVTYGYAHASTTPLHPPQVRLPVFIRYECSRSFQWMAASSARAKATARSKMSTA